MSGRPKRKRSKKSDATEDNVANDEVINVEVDDGTGDVVGSRNKKRSRLQRATNPPTPPTIDPESSSSSSSPSTLLNTHPHSRLPSYLSEAFSDLYSQDGLVVLGRGLGWLGLLCSFVRFYADASDDGYAATLDGGGRPPRAAGRRTTTETTMIVGEARIPSRGEAAGGGRRWYSC
jgi:hypothetical protein